VRLDTVVLAGGLSLGLGPLPDLENLIGGARDERILAPAESRELRATINASIAGPVPVGLRLRSDAFHWTVASCVDGRFGFTGFEHPSPRAAALKFPSLLFGLDRTGLAVNAPRPLPLDPFEANYGVGRRRVGPRFLLEIGANGLVR
jgi:hypothetical protein